MSARFSPCGRYRYELARDFCDMFVAPTARVLWIMLNPSTADAEKDDPTIRRCIGFSKAWAFTGLEVRNLFAWRATNPKELYGLEDPIGPENDAAILGAAECCPLIVAAWGAHPMAKKRGASVLRMLRGRVVHCLGPEPTPRHPLYVPAKAPLVPLTLQSGLAPDPPEAA